MSQLCDACTRRSTTLMVDVTREICQSLMLLHSLTTDHRLWWCIMRATAAVVVTLLGIFTCPAAAQTAVSLCCCVGFHFRCRLEWSSDQVDPDDALRSMPSVRSMTEHHILLPTTCNARAYTICCVSCFIPVLLIHVFT